MSTVAAPTQRKAKPKGTSASLAAPSTGGAARRTLRASPCRPATSPRDARGCRGGELDHTGKRIAGDPDPEQDPAEPDRLRDREHREDRQPP